MRPLVANARMYAPTAASAVSWRALFEEVSAASGVPLEVIDHAYPAPLAELWTRPDLGCAFMCGYPFARAVPQPRLVAAPLRQEGPVYRTALVVRADTAFTDLAATFGGRIGWTVEDSHSGFNAIRDLLPRYAGRVGPLVTPRRVIEAVLDGSIDVGPVDGYVLDLLHRHEPALTARLRTMATTRAAPIPPLVAAPAIDDRTLGALRGAFLALGPRPELLIDGFTFPDPADYDALTRWTF